MTPRMMATPPERTSYEPQQPRAVPALPSAGRPPAHASPALLGLLAPGTRPAEALQLFYYRSNLSDEGVGRRVDVQPSALCSRFPRADFAANDAREVERIIQTRVRVIKGKS